MVRIIQEGFKRYAVRKWSVRSTLKSRYTTQMSIFTFKIAMFTKKQNKREVKCQITNFSPANFARAYFLSSFIYKT